MKQSIFYRHINGSFAKKLWLFSVFFLFSLGSSAQCPSGSVFLTSQAEVDAFITSYPNCTIITESLFIGGEDITDLSPLNNITKVGGILNISNNTSLTNLNGLSSLTTIGRYYGMFGWEGGLRIDNNPVLADVAALSNLQSLTNGSTGSVGIRITNNPLLSVCNVPFFCTYLANTNTNYYPRNISGNAPGCQNVSAINISCSPPCPTGNFTFQNQAQIDAFLASYPNCTELPGSLQISVPIGGLTSLSSLSNLTKIGGNLLIDGSAYLTSLNGLDNLTEVGGNMKIGGSQLSNIQALSNLTDIGGYLEISGNKLPNLNGLDNLSQVGGRLHISDNTLLTTFNGLNGLTQIGGYLHIRDNPLLTSLNGLGNLTQVNGFIRILYNNTLTDISALSNIDPDTILADSGNYVDPSGIIITNNPQLSNCSISSFCTYLSGTGKRTISQNGASCNNVNAIIAVCNIPAESIYLYTQQDVDTYGASNPTLVSGNLMISGSSITSLSALNSLIKINGDLTIYNNSQLENLDGLNNVTEIDGKIEIITNAALQNLDGLDSVTQIDGNIVIQNNASLINVYGLENIDASGINQLKILSNIRLSSCDIVSFCEYLSLGNTAEVSGNSTVTGSTCTVAAIQQRCEMTCPSGDVLFITQADINHFASRFATCQNASLQNLNIVSIGSVPSDITDLTPLEGIVSEITGQFRLGKFNSSTTQIIPLTTLEGLESITSIGGNFYIEGSNLENTDGLDNLSVVGGVLRISDNPFLQNLNGFSSLTTLSKNLEITNNAVLSDISGFSSISQINQTAYSIGGGSTIEYRGLTITNNPDLAICNLDIFCTYLNTTGARAISGNAEGCQNVNTIKDLCLATADYCSVEASASSYEYITNVTFSDINNTTAGISGYNNYTSQIAEVTQGEEASIEVTISPDSNDFLSVFIDWNQDQVFDAVTETYILAEGTSLTDPFTMNINIPNDAAVGQTRMRVMLNWGQAPNSCQNISYGEIEDYTINVIEAVTEYCSAEASNSNYDYISNVKFSDINNTTTGISGYNNYTAQVAEVTKGAESIIEVTIYPDGNEYLSVFIDWNQDYIFDEVAETYILAEDSNLAGPFTMNIAVPSDAALGQTRMRVMLNWNAAPNSCQNISYGEIEDYTINVSESTACESTTYANSGWSNGLPNANKKAIVEGNLAIDTDLTACELEVTASGTVVVESGGSLTVIGSIANNNTTANSFVVQNDAILLQVDDVENTGTIKVERNSFALFRQDYALWSSPVAGQNLRAFSTQTLFNRFSSYDTAAGTNGAYFQEIVTTADMNTKIFAEAKGYLVRMPNNWTEWNSGTSASPYLGLFAGILNNGNIAIPLSGANTRFNLVGNPYPSPISIADFFAANDNVNETLYFWRKQASADSNNVSSGYSTYTSMGIVSADASINGTEPTHVEVGQGFFVVANTASPGNLVFTNAMRGNGAATFYKGTNNATTELHRFWLNLSNETNTVGQTLIGYKTGATPDADAGIDALYFNDSPVALTSIINQAEYIIQGRSLPFGDFDTVPLGFKTNVSGSYTISLSNFDGLFAENQNIFLKDNATNTLTNLKTSDYTFATDSGVFNSRFEVQYTNATLSVTDPNAIGNTVMIASKNQKIQINSGSIVMNTIELIDVMGRIIYMQEGVNATTATLENIAVNDQMLIVRIGTKENGVITQKIIF
ncbi:GEVED domain-containing protein [Flavobacterium sp. SM2513]|uniref:GEVED domain-containing protein n=1 Tax=Flavobacterium sp. SM2513 TaxID=3424766 RepID=UPI003D7F57FA